MTEVRTILNLDEVELEFSSQGTRFGGADGDIGQTLGLKGLGATLYEVPPGLAAVPFHRHHTSDEMFIVLQGTGTYRIGEERLPIRPGDCLGAPAGGAAHQIINTGGEPLRYIALSNNTSADVIEYVDSGRIRIDVGASGFHREDGTFKAGGRLMPMDYWEGEDVG